MNWLPSQDPASHTCWHGKKNFRPKYSLEHGQNTFWKIRKNPKFWDFHCKEQLLTAALNSLENEGICRSGAVNNCSLQWKSQNFGFFWVLVFFKLYFGHVPDSILAWKFFIIFFDPCRINKKFSSPSDDIEGDKRLVRPPIH